VSAELNFLKNNAEMLDAAQRCLELRQFLPALVLIYAHIDTLAWAASKKARAETRRNFEGWATRWLLPHLSKHAPEVTATDLFAARCGVLHTLTGKSDLAATGSAREISYAWGTGRVDVLRSAIVDSGLAAKLVALHYDDLLSSLRHSVADFVAYAESDAELSAQLEVAAGKHYENIAIPSSSRQE
jgi:hypothetical protein